jgi:hypothetical protein
MPAKANPFAARLTDAILTNAYDERSVNSAWQRYLKVNLQFPFDAVCTQQQTRSPLLPGERITATGLEKDDGHGTAAVIQWQDRIFSVPLEQLRPIDTDEVTSEAAGDWAYWCAGQKSIEIAYKLPRI